MWLVGSGEEMREGWIGFHRQQLKCWRYILAARGSPWEVWDLNPSWAPQPIAPELEKNPDNIQLWKAEGVLSVRERQLEM